MSKLKHLLISTLIIVIGILMIAMLLSSMKLVLSTNTINHVVFADMVDKSDIYVEIELKDLENDIKQNEVVALVALKGAREKILDEEQKRVEDAEKQRIKEEEELLKKLLFESQAKLTLNPFEKSNLTVEQYNNILKGTGLEGTGQSFYTMEHTYNVNGLFALSVAFQESGYGRHKANTNNYFGMRGNKGWMAFESTDANIQYFGRLMNKDLYKGKDIVQIGKRYCPGTYKDWADKVQFLMKKYFKKR